MKYQGDKPVISVLFLCRYKRYGVVHVKKYRFNTDKDEIENTNKEQHVANFFNCT